MKQTCPNCQCEFAEAVLSGSTELPKLPNGTRFGNSAIDINYLSEPHYTADQMRAYARSALTRIVDLEAKAIDLELKLLRSHEYVVESDRRVGEQFQAAQNAEANALRHAQTRLQALREKEAAEAVADRLRPDALRYRWLRDRPILPLNGPWIAGPGNEHIESDWLTGEFADAAIDNAIAELTGTPVADGGENTYG